MPAFYPGARAQTAASPASANATPTPAIDPALSSLAGQLAQFLRKVGAKRVVILDLRGPKHEAHPLGKWLGDRLAMALQKELPSAEIIDRAQSKGDQTDGQVPLSLSDVRAGALETGRMIGADTMVTGTFVEVTKGTLAITLNAFSPSTSGLRAEEITGSAQESEEVATLSPQPIPTRVVRAGVGGVKPPKCGHCPLPKYTDEARSAHFQGTVTLDIVATAKGRVENIVVVKSPGYGLAERATEKVKTWRLQPELDLNGQPISARIIVEVAFRMHD